MFSVRVRGGGSGSVSLIVSVRMSWVVVVVVFSVSASASGRGSVSGRGGGCVADTASINTIQLLYLFWYSLSVLLICNQSGLSINPNSNHNPIFS